MTIDLRLMCSKIWSKRWRRKRQIRRRRKAAKKTRRRRKTRRTKKIRRIKRKRRNKETFVIVHSVKYFNLQLLILLHCGKIAWRWLCAKEFVSLSVSLELWSCYYPPLPIANWSNTSASAAAMGHEIKTSNHFRNRCTICWEKTSITHCTVCQTWGNHWKMYFVEIVHFHRQ